jgi:hypothetical protein
MTSFLTALLPLLGVMIGSIISYASGRTLEARKQLSQERARAYTDFFRSVASVATQGRSSELLTLAADSKTRICIYGSVAAIGLLAEFERTGSSAGTDEGRAVLARLMQEVRRDLTSQRTMGKGAEVADVLFGPASKRVQDVRR